jgi:hypothetical protein
MLERLLPTSADNDYRGSRIALYVFVVLTAATLGRSLVHLLADDAGLRTIATLLPLTGDPDPNEAIYLFGSLWGLQQVILALLYVLVLIRYRSLLPLMYATLVLEWSGRLAVAAFLHPLGPEYFERTPPGAAGAVPVLVLAVVMLALSLRQVPRQEAPST